MGWLREDLSVVDKRCYKIKSRAETLRNKELVVIDSMVSLLAYTTRAEFLAGVVVYDRKRSVWE